MLAINKMDLVGYDQAKFDEIVKDYPRLRHADRHRRRSVPCRSRLWAATTSPSAPRNMPWYKGPTLMGTSRRWSSTTTPRRPSHSALPVQWVNRPNLDFRGFAGTDRGRYGQARRPLFVCCPRARARHHTHRHLDGDLEEAVAGQAMTLTLTDEVDCSRGDVIAAADRAA